MMMKEQMKTKYTFWELLNNYKIEIPKIQRDYAQGRKDDTIRKIVDKFLDELKNSIRNNEELNLDFVYGRVENDILIPLDGQQRLTTLFLIHWYIALKENKLTDDIKRVLSKFTYETRISSQDFCKNLVAESIEYNSINGSISSTITDSKWYFLSWELDPTVSAMLNMLDTIHYKFKEVEEPLFEKLDKEINITFQFLPLEQFKLTDELYIKMNARGKPLTEFENFKANFSQYLKSLEKKSKLDNEWLDIFWNLEKRENSEIITENVDEKFFNFFKNITLNFYAEINDIDRLFVDNYNLFDTYSEVYQNEKNVNNITKIFDGLISYNDTENIFNNFLTFSINYWERLRFYALGHFFIKYGQINTENKPICDRWLRVTKNLINNTLIQSADNYKDAIRSIDELSKNIDNIYTYVSSSSDTIKYFSKIQREEESLKAKIILEDKDWEKLFMKIEQHSYFDGQIGFVLQYSIKEDNNYHKALFDDYSIKISKIFSDVFKEDKNFLFQRALLTKGDYLPQVGNGENFTFCSFDKALRTKLDNWRKVFNDDDKTLFLKALLDKIEKDDISDSLEKIIKTDKVNDWRKYLIDSPDDISYCQYRQIRKYPNDEIYLLSKGQMNGRHKEIFSWDLFKRKFNNKEFLPFSNKSWYRESTSWDNPCIVISGFEYDNKNFSIDIGYKSESKFYLNFYNQKFLDIPENITKVLKDLKFNGSEIILSENKIEGKLNEICNELDNIE